MESRARRRIGSGTILGVFATLLVFAGIALAALGLQNPSFESDLDSWEVRAEHGKVTNRGNVYNREVVYGPGGRKGEVVPCEDQDPYGICVTGEDSFEVFEAHNGGFPNPKPFTVAPTGGSKMLRLGGPFLWEHTHGREDGTGRRYRTLKQNRHDLVAEQSFTVDPENPVLELNYNVFSWDQFRRPRDYFSMRLEVGGEDGTTLARVFETAPDRFTGSDLRSSGWQPFTVDLSGFEGQEVHLRIANKPRNRSQPTWTYVDAGLIPEPPVNGADVEVEAPPLPGGGQVSVNRQVDPATGRMFITVPNSQVSQFPSGCMPLELTVPIEPGAGTVSDVSLRLGNKRFLMSSAGGNLWRGTIDCIRGGDLFIEYTLTEDGASQTFVIPIGGLYLIDPQGVVYDQAAFAAAKQGGATDANARAAAALNNATVRLQRRSGGQFVNVFSGDPGITPNVNPQTTGADGLYQWDVSAGEYRVRVVKPGFVAVTSQAVNIPPPVLDLHIAMDAYDTKVDSGPGASTPNTTPTFGFSANDPAGSTFECKVDAGGFGPCSGNGTHTTSALASGQHTFQVRGTDSTGFVDPTPASRTFTVAPANPNPGPGPDPDPGPGPDPDPGPDPQACAAADAAVTAAQGKVKAADRLAANAAKKAKKAKKALKKAKKKGKGKKVKKAKKAATKAAKKAKSAKKGLAKAQESLAKAKEAQKKACA